MTLRLVISAFVFIGWLLVHFLSANVLHSMNRSFALSIQTWSSSDFVQFMMSAFSNYLVFLPLQIMMACHLFHNSKADSFLNMATVITCINLKTILKLFLHEYRPYLISDDIQALSCECTYGMPSGHSGTAAVGCLVMLETLRQIKNQKSGPVKVADDNYIIGDGSAENKTETQGNYPLWQVIPAAILTLGVGLSRVYYGVHSFS